MTGILPNAIELDRDIQATPDKVFTAWTEPDHFARWFGGEDVTVPAVSLDYHAEPGREWSARMVLPDGKTIDWVGQFVDVSPDERFVFTITDEPANPERARVEVTLTENSDASGSTTHQHVRQDTPGWTPDQQEAVIRGWEGFLDVLESIATR